MSAAAHDSPSTRGSDGWIAAALIAATLTPFVAVAIPPMTDLPQHVLVGQILLHLDDPVLRFGETFAREGGFRPLLAPHLLLAGLQSFAGPMGGAKLYLALFVVLTWLATWALLAAVRAPRPKLLACGALPLCLSGLVYMGFLPFVMSFPLYALLLAVWLRQPPSWLRTALGALLLLLLFVCHLVGAVVGAFAIFVIAAADATRSRAGWPALARDLVALVPVGGAVLWFVVLQDHPSDLHLRFYGPLGAVKALLSYNVRTLSDLASALNALGLLALAAGVWTSLRAGRTDGRLLLLTLALVFLGVAAPIAVGILWPAAPRLFPFAYLTALALLHPGPRGQRVFAALVSAIVVLEAGALVERSRAIDRDYARFLSGASALAPGSRMLPVIDTLYDRSGAILPFWSAGSLYTVERGGSHPYVFARPHWKTGGDVLHYRDYTPFTHAFLYEEGVAPERYRGAAANYDYVVVWNPAPGLDAVLAEEFELSHADGPLRVYGPKAASR